MSVFSRDMDGGRLADPAQVAQSGDIGLPIVPGLGKNASGDTLRLAEAFKIKQICLSNEKGHQPLLVGGVADHIHFLWSMSLKPKALEIPKLIQSIKNSTNHWLNEGLRCGKKFEWQEGYGCFSVSPTQRDQLEAYILDQPNHHKNESFLDEYDRLLRLNRGVNPQYKFMPLI